MLLTVFCVPRDRTETTFALDVSPELELSNFVALCELESGIPAGDIEISYAERPLRDLAQTLGNYGLKDGDVVVLRQVERRPAAQPNFPGLPRIDFSSIAVPGTSSNPRPTLPAQPPQPAPSPQAASPASSPQGLDNPALLRDMLLANPHELSLLKERNPPLAEALLSGDLERFTKVLLEQQQDRAKRERERIRLFTADPFDLEAQAKIEEEIRQHNIEENMTIAMEEAPESFGQVVMLYINCKVNGHPVKAFVDSGAQMTIMSQACAERCNIMRLVDRRWAGIAKGVGTQKIIGRVHLAQVQIEGDFLPCSFSILEDQPMDMLLGLDMLKRHQCSIDLKKNVLLIGTTGTETSFLPEAELPDCARLAYGPEGREETRPEELADRELAEALHRSIQDSDTADGTTTSPESPPLSFCKNLNTPSSSAPSQKPGFSIDRSKSAPASFDPSFTPVPSFGPFEPEQKTKPGNVTDPDRSTGTESSPTTETLRNPSNEQTSSSKPESQPVTDSLSFAPQTSEDFAPVLPAQEPFSFTISNENDVATHVTCGEPLNALDGEPDISVQDAEQTTVSSVDANSETCVQEMDMSSPDRSERFPKGQRGSMEFSELTPSTGQTAPTSGFEEYIGASTVQEKSISQEQEHAEGNCIPSLAQALKELHKLLMSNAQAPSAHHTQNASGSLSPTADPSSLTASDSTDAKLESDARIDVTAVDGGTLEAPELEDSSSSLDQDSLRRESQDGENVAGADSQAEGEEPSLHGHQEDAELAVVSKPLHSDQPASVSGACVLVPTESSQVNPDSTISQIGLYPTEHVQRIQAAGFTSLEATEALEQAEGSVELALLLLLARKITVPT